MFASFLFETCTTRVRAVASQQEVCMITSQPGSFLGKVFMELTFPLTDYKRAC